MTIESNNRQIGAYLSERPQKEHEKYLCRILERSDDGFNGRLLDIGCATGATLLLIRELFPTAELHGLELSPALIERAKENLQNYDVHLHSADAFSFEPEKPYDILIASGILAVFENPYPVLDKWLSWLTPKGKLIIFSAFNSNDLDVKIKFRNRQNDQSWETGFAWYSKARIAEFFLAKGYSTEFERFVLPIDLEKDANPIRQYTVRLENGERMLVNGANLIFEQYFMIARPSTLKKT